MFWAVFGFFYLIFCQSQHRQEMSEDRGVTDAMMVSGQDRTRDVVITIGEISFQHNIKTFSLNIFPSSFSHEM